MHYPYGSHLNEESYRSTNLCAKRGVAKVLIILFSRLLFRGMKKLFLSVVIFLIMVVHPVFSELVEGTIAVNLGNVKVYQGNFLPFSVTINKTRGNMSKGTLSYWVESDDGKRWAYESSTLSTGVAPYSSTLDREVYVYSTQPSQSYYLRVTVNFDEDNPAVTSGASFYVLPRSESSLLETIEITGVERDIASERDKPKYLRPKISNTGISTFHNVSLLVEGPGSEWFVVSPISYPELKPSQELSFTIEVTPTATSVTGDYPLTLLVITSEGEWNYHEFTLHTFASQHELITFDVQLLEQEVADYRLDVQKSLLEGRNVSQALRLISEIEVQVEFARQYLKSSRYSEASLALSNANDFLRQAKSIDLEVLTVEKSTSNIIIIGGFAFLFLLFLVTLLIYNHYSRRKFDKLMGVYATEIMRNIRREVEPPGVVVRLKEGGIKGPELMEQVKRKMEEETVKSLMEKMERVKMFLESIEEEFRSGKISQDSYEEIKEKSEERLKAIKDQLVEKGVKMPSDKVVKAVEERQEEKAREDKVKEVTKKSVPQKFRGMFNKILKRGGDKSGGSGKAEKEGSSKQDKEAAGNEVKDEKK